MKAAPGEGSLRIREIRIGLTIFLAIFTLAQIIVSRSETGPGSKIKIVVSIFPLFEFARAVAGEAGEVSLLLPPGANVHTWQPRASDMIRLSKADLIISIGQGLEPWFGDILKAGISPKTRLLTVIDSLSRTGELKAPPDKEDPHLWLDLEVDRAVMNLLAQTLGQIKPLEASTFAGNAALYNEKLKRLEDLFTASLSRCRQRFFLVGGHAAFGYLAAKYKLEQISLFGLSPDAEARPSRLADLISWAKKNSIRAVFKEAHAVDRMARVLAEEIGAELLDLHTGANLTKKEWTSGLTFLEIMEQNLVNLKKGLGCD